MWKAVLNNMILINLTGGPGAGKTTLTYYLAYRLKQAGIRTEVTAEASREHHIYVYPPDRVPDQLRDNQVLVFGQQFERIKRFQRHGFEVALCDSALEQQTMYYEGHPYAKNLAKVAADCAKQFETYNVFIHRTPGTYDAESRLQKTEAEAVAFDKKVRKLFNNKFWMEVGWNQLEELGDAVVKLALSKRKKKKKR
jgi:molybdopterin-guanine dinucleotide biosynthesis protein